MSESTPILLRADTVKNAYRGEALSQLRILKREMELGGLTVSARTVKYSNGVIISCRKCFNYETVDIFVPAKVTEITLEYAKLDGFIGHLKSGQLGKLPYYDTDSNIYTLTGIAQGGFSAQQGVWYSLSNSDVYQLVDDDKASFNISNKVKWLGSNDNYGNNYWSNGIVTLSWRGCPSVQFPIPSKYRIPGLSKEDGTNYTVFGYYVYNKGSKLCHVPKYFVNDESKSLVAGACISKDSSNVHWLVVLSVSHTDTGYIFRIHKSKDIGKTWVLIGEFSCNRLTVSASINNTGKLFVFESTLYRIDADITYVTVVDTKPDADAGTLVITGDGGYESEYSYAGSINCWAGIKNSELSYETANISAMFGYSGNVDNSTQTRQVPLYRGNPATQVSIKVAGTGTGGPCTVSGDGVNVQLVAEVNGTYCQAVWSGVDCYKGLSAVKKVPTCDSAYTVSVTIQPQGITATYEQTAGLPAILISGPVDIGLNNQYSAANAVGDVTWSINKGQINANTGVITSISGASCGTAIITATDKCGRTGVMYVKCPSGVWLIDPTYVDDYVNNWYDAGASFCGTGPLYCGVLKYDVDYCAAPYGYWNWTDGCPPRANTRVVGYQTLASACGYVNYVDGGNYCHAIGRIRTRYIWSCATP